MFEVTVDQTFAAAHALRNYKGGCENVHGHNFKVQVVLAGERLDNAGLLVDFIDVKNLMGEILARLDQQNRSLTTVLLTGNWCGRRPPGGPPSLRWAGGGVGTGLTIPL